MMKTFIEITWRPGAKSRGRLYTARRLCSLKHPTQALDKKQRRIAQACRIQCAAIEHRFAVEAIRSSPPLPGPWSFPKWPLFPRS